MANEIKFNNTEFTSLGIHFEAQQWTLEQVKQLVADNMSFELEQLLTLATNLGLADDAVILSTYTVKQTQQVNFSLPRAHLNKDGSFCLFVGNAEVLLVFEAGKYLTTQGQPYQFKVAPRRQDPKNAKSEIKGINLEATIAQEIDGIEEEFKLVIPVKTKKDSDLPSIIKFLQSGDVSADGLVRIGEGGGGLEPYLKPYMLPKGYYKITSVNEPKYLPQGGKIWEGTVVSLDTQEVFKVQMGSAPFVVGQRETLLISAKAGKPVYLLANGAYGLSDGKVGAIAHAAILKEENGSVPSQIWEAFTADAKRITAANASKNSKSLLTDADITAKREEFLGNEKARIQEWIAKQEATKVITDKALATVTVVGATTSPDDDEIPF